MLELLTPWEPLWWLIALFAVAAGVYARGLAVVSRPVGAARAVAFFGGLLTMYGVLQTRFDYYAQHMFFIHRIQHLVLHHVGPFLIALSAPASALAAGLPRRARRVVDALGRSRVLRTVYRVVQQPVVAGIVFVGLIAWWLLPAVHFDAMLNAREYWTMNLSMAVDGLLFWWLILDPRAPGSTPVTRGTGIRALVLWGVMLPQIAMGAVIALTPRTLFDVYAVCGRAWPITPLLDQQLGGLITWIPAAMMSAAASLVLLRYRFRHDRAVEAAR